MAMEVCWNSMSTLHPQFTHIPCNAPARGSCTGSTRRKTSGRSGGLGTYVKLLKHKETGKVRLVMRQAKTLNQLSRFLFLGLFILDYMDMLFQFLDYTKRNSGVTFSLFLVALWFFRRSRCRNTWGMISRACGVHQIFLMGN